MAIIDTKITIAGEERRLRFDINAVSDVFEHLGVGLEEVPSLAACRALVWAGIKYGERQPRFTIEAAGDLITEHLNRGADLQELTAALFQALSKSFPAPAAAGAEGKAGNAEMKTESSPAT